MASVTPNAALVSWQKPAVEGGAVTGFTVERMTEATFPSELGSYFGLQEVQVIDTYNTGNNSEFIGHGKNFSHSSGSFTLAFGADDALALPGTMRAIMGAKHLITTDDLTPYVARGDPIIVGGVPLQVAEYGVFNGTYVSLESKFTGPDGDAHTAATSYRTVDIAYDASAATFEAALEALPTIGQLRVTRSFDEDYDGYSWTVTFLSDMGDLPALAPNVELTLDGADDDSQDDNNGAGEFGAWGHGKVRVRTVYDGAYPEDYVAYAVADAEATSLAVPQIGRAHV